MYNVPNISPLFSLFRSFPITSVVTVYGNLTSSDISFSNKLFIAKPSSLIFKKIINDFEFKADQIVHAGDNIFTDIFGAKKIGIRTVHINKRKSVHNYLNFTPDYTVRDISGLLNFMT